MVYHLRSFPFHLRKILPRPTRLSMMRMSTVIKPRKQATALGVSSPQCRVCPWDALEAESVFGHAVCNALCIEQVRVMSQVVDVVALLVVARIEWLSSLTAKELRFLGCLEYFGAGEEAAGGNAVFQEGGVVGAEREE